MTDFKRISPETAQQIAGAVVVDIRDPHSYASGHISGSTHGQSFAAGLHRRRRLRPSADRHLLPRPFEPERSSLSGQPGCSDVYSLDGGFELWRATFPLDVERDDDPA
ncbi:Thiosulfate sulfurtransferase GlpE OS=Stutzerimonas stutzeri OX=316 GN=glpE PE=3 SV=1 [Stutzerimonas stutzeri]